RAKSDAGRSSCAQWRVRRDERIGRHMRGNRTADRGESRKMKTVWMLCGALRRSPSPTSEVGFIEHRLEDRLQPIEQRLLAYPIENGRGSPHSKLARLARPPNVYLPHRLRLIGVLF